MLLTMLQSWTALPREPIMGLFGGKERKRQAFVQKVEDLAG